ncbi:hypothetical protein [Flammeovirga sp. SubArs3]|uniref:hypothetical protein n=1 Tax=Flammeovirga sp. SubArs3 TaxID=2995316 RepID=UPI00248CBDAF|nr:hypothetical protein [Flammeovirga sp. SubArs3]
MEWLSSILLLYFIFLHWSNNQKHSTSISKYYPYLLIVKLLLGIAIGLLYSFYYRGGDTFGIFKDANTLREIAINQPLDYLDYIFSKPYRYPEAIQSKLLQSNASTAIFAILLSFASLLTGGNYWVTSLYLSFFSFICIWRYLYSVYQIYPKLKYSLIIPFFLLPSFSLWSSGIVKECLSMAFLFYTLSICIDYLSHNTVKKRNWLLAVIFLFLLFQIKFYYGALFIALSPMMIVFKYRHQMRLKSWKWVLLPSFLITLVILTLPFLHHHLNYHQIVHTIYLNYQKLYSASAEGHAIFLPLFDDSINGLIQSLPTAIIKAFTSPKITSESSIFYVIIKIENFLVLGCYLLSIYFLLKNDIIKKRLWLLWTFMYISIIIILFVGVLAIASPNYGSLNRYKIGAVVLLFQLSLSSIEIHHTKNFSSR